MKGKGTDVRGTPAFAAADRLALSEGNGIQLSHLSPLYSGFLAFYFAADKPALIDPVPV